MSVVSFVSRAALASLFCFAAAASHAATITIVNLDGPGEGFNDPTQMPQSGTNAGTRGQQRLKLFQQAAAVWAAKLTSNIEIKVGARFDPLECDSNGAVLGSAGPTTVTRNFTNAPATNRWYPIALAEARANANLNADAPDPNEISARFNSAIDTGCIAPTVRWWYGFTPDSSANTIDLFPVVLHELGHGLGFLTLACDTPGGCGSGFPQGSLLDDRPDAWTPLMRDTQTGLDWTAMTNNQRASSMTNDPDLVWTGPYVTAALATFQPSGNGRPKGFMRLHAPSAIELGSSLSHFSEAASPNLLMEPALSGDVFDATDLTVALFRDIGWAITPGVNAAPVITAPASYTATEDAPLPLTGLSLTDADAEDGTLDATVAVSAGALNFPQCPGVTLGGSAASRTFVGKLANLAPCLANGLVYTPNLNDTTARSLTITVDDNGNTGTGGVKSATVTVPINFAAVNDTPVVAAPNAGYDAVEDTTTSSLGGIAFADVDAGTATLVATFAVPSGTINVANGTGVVIGGTPSARTLTGRLSNLNALVDNGISYTPAANASGDVVLTISLNDQGAQGSGGAKTGTRSVTIDVAAINDTPVLTAPSPVNFEPFLAKPIVLTVDDDATGSITLTLLVDLGGISSPTCTGVTPTGTDSARVLTGTVAALNACFAAGSVRYTGNPTVPGNAMLTINANDQGGTGAGGARTAAATVSLVRLASDVQFRDGFE